MRRLPADWGLGKQSSHRILAWHWWTDLLPFGRKKTWFQVALHLKAGLGQEGGCVVVVANLVRSWLRPLLLEAPSDYYDYHTSLRTLQALYLPVSPPFVRS
jgi:hypothetical protein